MGDTSVATQVATKWRKKRGSLIMALHEIQDIKGYVPWEDALEVAQAMNIPLARIYEVLTFYNFSSWKLPARRLSRYVREPPVIKRQRQGSGRIQKELGIGEGESTPDRTFHLQCVRCVGCCGLAPVCVVNGKTYGRVTVGDVHNIIDEWRKNLTTKTRSWPMADMNEIDKRFDIHEIAKTNYRILTATSAPFTAAIPPAASLPAATTFSTC